MLDQRFIRIYLNMFRTFWLIIALAITAPNAWSGEADGRGTDEDYRISAEDVLEISVWREPELLRTVTVRPDGGISFPLVGDLRVANLTPAEVEGQITESISKFIPDAVVTVSVEKVMGLRIYVNGKVRSPGQFLVGRYVDVLQALTLAGGLTPFADRKNIKILRRINGRETVMKFNYEKVEKGQNLSQNVILRSDDTIVVP